LILDIHLSCLVVGQRDPLGLYYAECVPRHPILNAASTRKCLP
jgi:hypothetical protein